MIVLSKPEPMKKVSVIYPLEYKDRVISLLQEAGVVDIALREPGKLVAEYETLLKLRERILNLFSRIKGVRAEVELTAFEAVGLTVDKVRADISVLEAQVNKIDSELSRLKSILEDLQALKRALFKLPGEVSPRDLHYQGKRVSSILAVCKRDVKESILKSTYVKAYSEFLLDEESVALLIYVNTQDFGELLNMLRAQGAWYPSKEVLKYIEQAKTIEELREIALGEIVTIQNTIRSLEEGLKSLIKDHLQLLGKYLLYVDNILQKYSALGNVRDLKHVSTIAGWIPESRVDELSSRLAESGIPLYVELGDPEPGDNPPTLMKNKPVIRFFQVITRLYGVPGYREWDPTPIIAYSFALFFGLMNSDAGYALLGILATTLLLDKLVENPGSVAYREFKGVLLVANTIALVFGFLSGAFFGDLMKIFGVKLPIILEPLISPLEFVKLSLIVGLMHVNVAHALATTKFIKEKRIGELLIEIGLFIGELFGIPFILKNFLRFKVPILGDLSEDFLLTASLFGVTLIVIGSILTMRSLGLLMWIFQITGLLGDVLSYVRLAGVGLATYYMALTFNFMVKSVADYLSQVSYVVGVIVAIPLLSAAHLLVLILAQLGAFVHSLRLCMLEFLTKFYEGSGYEYNPFRVINRAVIVL